MATRRRLIWNVAPAYLLVIVLGTVAVALYAGSIVKKVYSDRVEIELENKSNLFVGLVKPTLAQDRAELQSRCRQWAADGGVRVTVMLPSGEVIADSHENPAVMDNHASRPEMAAALKGEVGRAVRFSNTLKAEMQDIARPVHQDGQLVAVVRIGITMTDLSETLAMVYWRVALGGLVVILISGATALYVFHRHVVGPLHRLQHGAQRFAAGDMTEPIADSQNAEFALLTDVLNTMARQLDEKIRTITQQAREQEAVLAGMIEGVIAVDADERVIMLNAAAAQWLDVDMGKAHGRMSYEVIRNIKLQDLIAQALDRGAPVEAEISLRGEDDRLSLAAQAAPLHTEHGGGPAGVVVVLHDVTRLRHLETVRQQFVSNVSHELKTPIAAIKAAVETLIDEREPAAPGEAAPPSDNVPDVAPRFLAIIARQADRLNAIVEDLLMLARIEEEEQDRKLALSRGPVLPVLRGAVETCQARADEKAMTVTIESDPSIEAMMNAPLLEQAVVNMLDNAIKYSPPRTDIVVAAKRDNGEIVLGVQDRGPGIEKVHLPRVFERFYRTDKARSRALGGTGLGLAIVKHVAQAHGGRVSVDSSQDEGPSRGSTFRIHLPVR